MFCVECPVLIEKYKSIMASSSRRRGPAAPAETSETIAEQTASFLKTGGKVEQVPRGISGQVGTTGKKHITISTKKV